MAEHTKGKRSIEDGPGPVADCAAGVRGGVGAGSVAVPKELWERVVGLVGAVRELAVTKGSPSGVAGSARCYGYMADRLWEQLTRATLEGRVSAVDWSAEALAELYGSGEAPHHG